MLDEPAAAEGAFAPNDSLATGVFVTRDLVSEPSNVKYPKTIAKDIEALVEDGIEVELFDRERMASLGMGSLLGVAQGQRARTLPRHNALERAPEDPTRSLSPSSARG